jgi:hypothetical protein
MNSRVPGADEVMTKRMASDSLTSAIGRLFGASDKDESALYIDLNGNVAPRPSHRSPKSRPTGVIRSNTLTHLRKSVKISELGWWHLLFPHGQHHR